VITDDWSVNFVGPDGKTRIGPWLLLDSHEEVRAILRWGNITDEELAEHESSVSRRGASSAVLNLTDRQLAALIERGRGRLWNGYELRLMKEAGKYPPPAVDQVQNASFRLGRWFVLVGSDSGGVSFFDVFPELGP
jgi:hypothetical protein